MKKNIAQLKQLELPFEEALVKKNERRGLF
jgi:hypothetical protein